jgi:GntR family transcriptional regulator
LRATSENNFEFSAMPVDSTSPVPAYLQLEQDLRRQIQSGIHVYGSRLPPEQTLARLYGVSRVTARQALQRLSEAGLISRRHGVGTIVTPSPEVILDLKPMESVTKQLRHKGYSTQIKVLEQDVRVPNSAVATALKLASGEAAIFVRRLLFAENSPVSIMSSWLPQQLFPGLEKVTLSSVEDSLWAVLASVYKRTPNRGSNVLEIISSTAQEAETLQIGFGVPLINLICVFTDSTGQPIEHSTVLWITSRVRLHF